jgi:crotonobetainyl-CoA:carnitine CoA-transferase CaiB-like acyl-CoA transferase
VVPHNHYQAGDGSWIAIACTNDRMFERLVRDALARPELLVEFATVDQRLKSREAVDELVGAWVGQFPAAEALARLDAAQVPCALVNSVRDLFSDPQIRARENIVSVPSPLGGLLHMAGIVPKLSATPGAIDGLGPLAVGEHNEEIYCGRLGLTREDLAALRARGVV